MERPDSSNGSNLQLAFLAGIRLTGAASAVSAAAACTVLMECKGQLCLLWSLLLNRITVDPEIDKANISQLNMLMVSHAVNTSGGLPDSMTDAGCCCGDKSHHSLQQQPDIADKGLLLYLIFILIYCCHSVFQFGL